MNIARLALFLALLTPVIRAENVLTITKTPFEVFDCSVDFSEAVGTDAVTLNSVSSTSTSPPSSDPPASIIASSPTPAIVPSTKKVVFAISGGVNGRTYIVSVKVIDTTTGEQFEGKVTVMVRE